MSLGRSACLACLLLAARASAQSESDLGSQALFGRAEAAYEAGDWATAVHLLEEAYALSPRPAFLFNIGQAQRKLGLCARARASYAAYLAAEHGSAAAEARTAAAIRELERCREPETGPTPEPPPRAAVAPRFRPTTPAPAAVGDPLAVRLATWSLLAGGTAAVLAAGYFAIDAHATASDLERAQRWDAAQSRRERDGRAAAAAARVLLGTGVGLLGSAIAVQLVFGASEEPVEPRLTVGVTSDSIGASYAREF